MALITPARSPRPRQFEQPERLKKFGSPAKFANGKLVPDAAWERANIVALMVPWPVGERRAIRVHRLAAPHFRELFARWQEQQLLDRIKTFGGGHVCRLIRGREGSTNLAHLSNHSYGTAIDLNVLWNPRGKESPPAGAPGSLVELVPTMYACGFVWGGDFRSSDKSNPMKLCDPMHIELGVIEPADAVGHA